MAETRLIAMHQNKGKSVGQCLKDRTDYAKNGEKTEQGEITPEKANEIGYETAIRFTKGNHAFIVATHTDRGFDLLIYINKKMQRGKGKGYERC